MRVWAIASREPEATVQAFVDYYGVALPVLLDADGAVIDAYAMRLAFPDTIYPQQWLIGPGGEIVYANNGYEPDELVAAIERELAR